MMLCSLNGLTDFNMLTAMGPPAVIPRNITTALKRILKTKNVKKNFVKTKVHHFLSIFCPILLKKLFSQRHKNLAYGKLNRNMTAGGHKACQY